MKTIENKGILLDRDGVLLVNRPEYVKSVDEVSLIPGTLEAIRLLWEKRYKICVVTNQSGVAKGLYTQETVQQVHKFIEQQFLECGTGEIYWYFCPHRDEDQCLCRKPKPGMLLSAIEEHDLVPEKTWLVGDALRDIEAGKKVGCHTALVLTGLGQDQSLQSNPSEKVYPNLVEFIKGEII